MHSHLENASETQANDNTPGGDSRHALQSGHQHSSDQVFFEEHNLCRK